MQITFQLRTAGIVTEPKKQSFERWQLQFWRAKIYQDQFLMSEYLFLLYFIDFLSFESHLLPQLYNFDGNFKNGYIFVTVTLAVQQILGYFPPTLSRGKSYWLYILLRTSYQFISFWSPDHPTEANILQSFIY